MPRPLDLGLPAWIGQNYLKIVYNSTYKVVTLQWAFGSNLHNLEKLCKKSYEKL